MIGIGFDARREAATIRDYVDAHGIEHVVILYPKLFPLALAEAGAARVEHVEYAEIIMYRFYYRLLQEIGPRSLVVVHECMRTQNRNDLTYNCIRHYLAQTPHVLVFQARPLIDTVDDFGILFDFATHHRQRERWKRTPFAELPLREATIMVDPKVYGLDVTTVAADAKTQDRYAKTKRDLVDGIGHKDPHTIPRNLHLIGGRTRAAGMLPMRTYVARNARIKSPQIVTYAKADAPADALDFPHRFLDWSDFLTRTGQTHVGAVMTDLKVDQWYVERFRAWCQRVNDAQADLHR